MGDVILQNVLKSVILQQELISQGRQSLWALSVALNFSQPRSVLFYTSFDGNKPCTLLNMGLKGFFHIYTHTSMYMYLYMFEIFCTLFIVWIYLLTEDMLIASVEYLLLSVLGSGR